MRWTEKSGDLTFSYDMGSKRELLRDGRTTFPRAFTISGRPPSVPDGVTLEVDVELDRWGHPQCRRVEFTADEGVVLNGESLRIPLKQLVAGAVERAAMSVRYDGPVEGGHEFSPVPRGEQKRAAQAAKRAVTASGRLLGEEHHLEVARVYNAASKNPTSAVQREMKVPYSTAARWVSNARKAGHIAPVGSRPTSD